MSDMKNLMENWRGYEKGALNELAYFKGINRYGLPSAEEIEYLQNLSDDELADLNADGAELTRSDIDDMARFDWSDLIHDPDDPIDNAMLATQAGLAVIPAGVTQAAAGALRTAQTAGRFPRKLYKAYQMAKKYGSYKNAKEAARLKDVIKNSSAATTAGAGVRDIAQATAGVNRAAANASLRLQALEQGKTLDQIMRQGQKTFTSAADAAKATDAARAADAAKAAAEAAAQGSGIVKRLGKGAVTTAMKHPKKTAAGAAVVASPFVANQFIPATDMPPSGPESTAASSNADIPSPASTSSGGTTSSSPSPAPTKRAPATKGETPQQRLNRLRSGASRSKPQRRNESLDVKTVIREEIADFMKKRDM